MVDKFICLECSREQFCKHTLAGCDNKLNRTKYPRPKFKCIKKCPTYKYCSRSEDMCNNDDNPTIFKNSKWAK